MISIPYESIEQDTATHVRNTAIRQLAIPLILHLPNLTLLIQMNSNNTLNQLLLIQPLDNISRPQIHEYRVPRILNLVVEPLNLTKRTLQPVPLRGVLLTSLGDGDGVREGGVVAPELQFGQRGAAGEEVEDGAYDGVLLL